MSRANKTIQEHYIHTSQIFSWFKSQISQFNDPVLYRKVSYSSLAFALPHDDSKNSERNYYGK